MEADHECIGLEQSKLRAAKRRDFSLIVHLELLLNT